jgi:site-specific DNA-methyltransferase (adenine-specific)
MNDQNTLFQSNETTKPQLRVTKVNGSPSVRFHNVDCMEFMKTIPDKFYDLAIVDPPYGLGKRLVDGGKKGGMGSLRKLSDGKVERWDIAPDNDYFNELFRVSKDQIIWGGNYFLDYLGSNDGVIIWDKMNGTNALADAEIAWKSMPGTTRVFRMHHFSAGYEDKIHPTQKPTKLYKWLLLKYAKEGWKVLDTHGGSMSLSIAADDFGVDLDICEIDSEYFQKGVQRFQQYKSQKRLF